MSNEVGRRIATTRAMYGLNRTQLAVKIDVSRAMVSLYEKGTNEPSQETAELLAKLFDADPEWFLGGDGKPPRQPAFPNRPRPDEALLGMAVSLDPGLLELTLKAADGKTFGDLVMWALGQKAVSLPDVLPPKVKP